jgi:superfamily II DNA/RNA helicase
MGGEVSKIQALNTADYIAQVLVAPWVLDPTGSKESPKLKEVVHLLNTTLAGGGGNKPEKLVLACRHINSCKLAHEYFTANGISSVMYTGEEGNADKRYQMVRDFVDGDVRVFIASAAGARGVDGLQEAASTIYFLDLPHVPATVVQFLGRLARRGQKHRMVNLFFGVMEDTIEEGIMDKLHMRQGTADRIYDEAKADLFQEVDTSSTIIDLVRKPMAGEHD